MGFSFSRFLAFRYFRAKKNETFVSIISGISLIGITIGVAALIVVMSVMNGYHVELVRNIIGLGGDINITPISREIKNHDKLISHLEKYPYIKNISKSIQGQALASSASSSTGVIIRGIDVADLKNKGAILDNVFDGSFTNYVGSDVVAVGSELAYQLDLHVGSKLKLISPNMLSTAFGSIPRARNFTVVAVFGSGLYEYDAATVLMPIKAAEIFLSLKDSINLLELNIDDSDMAHMRAKELQQEFRPGLNISKDKESIDINADSASGDNSNFALRVISWDMSNQQFLTALEIERVAMFTILSLIILVAAFNIISSLFMVVKDKTKDIAILRTMGATRSQIMRAFIINGMIIGIIGTASGICLGLLIAKNIERIRIILEKFAGFKIFDPAIYFLYSLPSVVKYDNVFWIGAISITLCFLATIYPAYKASSLNPVEAMRYE